MHVQARLNLLFVNYEALRHSGEAHPYARLWVAVPFLVLDDAQNFRHLLFRHPCNSCHPHVMCQVL